MSEEIAQDLNVKFIYAAVFFRNIFVDGRVLHKRRDQVDCGADREQDAVYLGVFIFSKRLDLSPL